MKCPLGRKFSICQDANGFFLGAKDGNKVCCRVTNYVKIAAQVLTAPQLSIPCVINCEKEDICVGEEEPEWLKNGQNSFGQEFPSLSPHL